MQAKEYIMQALEWTKPSCEESVECRGLKGVVLFCEVAMLASQS